MMENILINYGYWCIVIAVLAVIWYKRVGFIRSYQKLLWFMLITSLILVGMQIKNFFGNKQLADFCNIAPIAISVYLCMGFWHQMDEDIADKKLGESMYATLMVAQGTFYTFVGVSSILISFTNTSGEMDIAALISGLKLAFLTSVVGILFSIGAKIKMKYSTENSVTNRKRYLDEQNFFDKLEQIYSNLNNVIYLNKKSTNNGDKTNKFLQDMISTGGTSNVLLQDIISIQEDSNKQLMQILQNYISVANENLIKNHQLISKEIVNNINEAFGRIANNTEYINDTLEYTGKTVEQFSGKFTALLASQADFVQKFTDVNTLLDKRNEEYKNLLNIEGNLIEEKNKQQKESLEKHMESQKAYYVYIYNQYQAYQQQLQQLTDAVEQHKQGLDSMYTAYLDDMKRYIQETSKQACEVIEGRANTVLGNQVEQYTETLKALNDKYMNALTSNQQNITQNLNELAEFSKGTFERILKLEHDITQEYEKKYQQLEAERKEREKADIERSAREEAERKAWEQTIDERRAREQEERKAWEQAMDERRVREKEERKAWEQVMNKHIASEQAERKTREDYAVNSVGFQRNISIEEAGYQAREQAKADFRAKEEAERKAREQAEAERRAREEAERKAREQAEAEHRAKEAERKAREQAEAERRAKEAERKAREQAEAERRAKEAERKAREQAEEDDDDDEYIF